jgi:hypothetical protein
MTLADPYTYRARTSAEARGHLEPGIVVKIQQSLLWERNSMLVRIDATTDEQCFYTYRSDMTGQIAQGVRNWEIFDRPWCLATSEEEAQWLAAILTGGS